MENTQTMTISTKIEAMPAVPAISAARTYSSRSNCASGARKALNNGDAKPGADFEIMRIGARFSFRSLSKLDPIKSAGK